MSKETNRRDFIGYSFAAVAAVGGAASLVGMKQAWDPLPSVLAGGFTEINLSPLKAVLYSTAEWTKFSPTVLNALKQNSEKYSDKEALEEISSKYNATLPQSIKDLFSAKINHSSVIEKENIESEIVKFIRKS